MSEVSDVIEISDLLREACVAQGYVPSTCTLPGVIVFHCVKTGQDPCHGCNMDRAECKGREKRTAIGWRETR